MYSTAYLIYINQLVSNILLTTFLFIFLAVSLLLFADKQPSKRYKTVSRILIEQIRPGKEIFEKWAFWRQFALVPGFVSGIHG